jgi:nicotinamidase-related amidase
LTRASAPLDRDQGRQAATSWRRRASDGGRDSPPNGEETPTTGPSRRQVDLQYATGNRETGLGAVLAQQGKLHEAEYRSSRIDELVVPTTKRLLEAFREKGLRRIFLTYGSEVTDCSDLSDQMFNLCRATRNWVGEREHEILDELKPEPTERVFNKINPSAFNSTP